MTYLKNHTVMTSTDVDELRDVIAQVSVPHEIDLKEQGAQLNARMAAASFGRLNMVHLSYGQVHIDVKSPEEDVGGHLLCLVTDGHAEVSHAGQDWTASTEVGSFRRYREPLQADQHDLACIGVHLPADILTNHARTLIGDSGAISDLEFNPSVDFTTPEGRILRSTILHIANLLDGPLREIDSPIMENLLEEQFLTQVLMLLPNTLQSVLFGNCATKAVPFYVKRARDYIHEYVDEKISLSDLARAAGCGYRTLQGAFGEAYGMSPMKYVQVVRLTRVRDALLQADPGVSIADTASRWGFVHMGRFSRIYRQQFGEFPSETLRRRS